MQAYAKSKLAAQQASWQSRQQGCSFKAQALRARSVLIGEKASDKTCAKPFKAASDNPALALHDDQSAAAATQTVKAKQLSLHAQTARNQQETVVLEVTLPLHSCGSRQNKSKPPALINQWKSTTKTK
jgi:hypothetical protein